MSLYLLQKRGKKGRVMFIFRDTSFRCLIMSCCVWMTFIQGSGAAENTLWTQTPDQIVEKLGRFRAGADLTPKSWPGNKKVVVSLSFDVDTEPVWAGMAGLTSPSYMSRGEYGARAGMPRIVSLLEKHEIPATFFVPVLTMELHPEIVPMIQENPRNEIGFHSYVHENPLSLNPSQEKETYLKGLQLFRKHVGENPTGFRSAAWDLTESTVSFVRELGFIYDSSMMADDRPYILMMDGEDSGLIELPVEWILDDWPYFQLNWAAGHVGLRNASDVYSIWKEEFDGAYEEGGMFILTLHPQVIGHRYRIAMLERLITYMKSRPDVWFATHEEIAIYVREQAIAKKLENQ